MKRNYSRLLIVILIVLVVTFAGVIALAFTSTNPVLENTTNSSGVKNPDDEMSYIQATESPDGVVTIKQDVTMGDQSVYIGKIEVIGDYMYVYGYYYNSGANPQTNNLNGWKMQTSDLGWGCVAIDKSKQTYADPAGVINGQKVTWMNNCYYNCKNMITKKETQWRIPRIPATVKHTNGMFVNCTGLAQISITTAHELSADTFKGCTLLKSIFFGQNITNVSSAVFRDINSSCNVYIEGKAKPSAFPSGWDSSVSKVYYNSDILIWAVEPNYIPA